MNNITSPLHLAVGSHEAGSGKGCAMNVISWENGDEFITDWPRNVSLELATLIHIINDNICTHISSMRIKGTELCPDCSVKALHLAHKAIGTDKFSIKLTKYIPEKDLRKLQDRMINFHTNYIIRYNGTIKRLKEGAYEEVESIIDDIWAYFDETPVEPDPEKVTTAINRMLVKI